MTDLRKAADYTKPGAIVPVNMETTQLLVEALRQALAMEKFSEVNQEIEEALKQPEQDTQTYFDGIPETKYTAPPKQPEQEPVAHLWECIGRWTAMIAHDGKEANLAPPDWLIDAVKAATAPPKREWVGLTDDEIIRMARYEFPEHLTFKAAKAIEAKLKEKNT